MNMNMNMKYGPKKRYKGSAAGARAREDALVHALALLVSPPL